MTAARIWLLTASLGLSACRNREPPAPQAPPSPGGVPADLARRSIMERLAFEAQNRPAAAAPKAEAVAAALAAAGLPLERWKQVLGSPIGARFCMNGQTAQGTVVAVCEFGDSSEANAGVSYSHKTFDPLIPNRSLIQRGPTVLTITRPGSTAPAAVAVSSGEVDRVSQIFARL